MTVKKKLLQRPRGYRRSEKSRKLYRILQDTIIHAGGGGKEKKNRIDIVEKREGGKKGIGQERQTNPSFIKIWEL